MTIENTLNKYADQIQQWHAPQFAKDLRESVMLPGLVSKDYQGEIKAQGNKVIVTQLTDPTAEIMTISTSAPSANTFNPLPLDVTEMTITADKRVVASYVFDDLTKIQSLIDGQSPEVMDTLRYSLSKRLHAYLYSLFAPSSSAPDHVHNSITAFSVSTLKALRQAAGSAKWADNKPWILLLDPVYHADILDDSKMASADYVGDDRPMLNGKHVTKRMGFNIIEDNSMPSKTGLAFHPDAVHLVMQREPTFKISDLHSNRQFGYVMSVDMIFGAAQGFNHSLLCQSVLAT